MYCVHFCIDIISGPSGDSIKEGGPVDPFSEISQDKPSLEVS